mgnify:CR=1 FL=1
MKILQKRFEELLAQLTPIEQSKRTKHGQYNDYIVIDSEAFLEWRIKTKNLLSKCAGKDSEHYKAFREAEKPQSFESEFDQLKRARAAFKAAKEDYEGGYMSSYRKLTQAEVFDTELDQAKELCENGYYQAAAVIAGTVLETTLKTICMEREISTGKLDKMNADLAKENLYNKLTQKRITALADIRNNAAHGNTQNYTNEDVKQMIPDVERIISELLQA